MRKMLIASASIAVLLGLLLSLRITGAGPLGLTPTAFSFLPHVVNEITPLPSTPTSTPTPKVGPPGGTPTPSPTSTPTPAVGGTPTPSQLTPTPTPTVAPPDPIVIVELSGHSDPEYVDIYNRGATAQDMTGWYIVSVIGQETFFFPDGYILNSAALVQVESGSGATHNPPLQLLWTSETVWNNSGDRAILYNSSDQAVSSACYGIGCAQGSLGSGAVNP